MPDLIEAFFQRDLSEAEHAALVKLLEGSPEEARRYAGLLEENYRATGLPQPSLPKGLDSLRPLETANRAWPVGSLKLLLVGLAATAGVLVWKYWPKPQAENLTPMPAVIQPVIAPVTSPIEKKALKAAPVQPLPVAPEQQGRELSIVVNAPQRSLVTVRILDAGGREVRTLYTGFVEAGRWDFQWDGLLANGRPADAGNYLIDVQSGDAHLSKNIQIKIRPSFD